MAKIKCIKYRKIKKKHTCFESSTELTKYLFEKILVSVNMSNEDVKHFHHEIDINIHVKREENQNYLKM